MERLMNTPTQADLREWMEQNPMRGISNAVGDIETNTNFMEDAICIMEQLIQPLADEASNVDLSIEVTRSQIQALHGAMNYIEILHQNIEEGIKELYSEILTANKKSHS